MAAADVRAKLNFLTIESFFIMTVQMFHNPKCSKSRATLALIREQGVEPEIFEYLKAPLSEQRLNEVLKLLDMRPVDLLRKKQKEFVVTGLVASEATDDQLIAAMIDQPILIERPIVINGDRAVIGRPPENVLAIL